ncbi:helix-turn-helix domain-containing protein [Shouchella patagoniensis]|uniref:helix-turn-helix domain-containing protein n=1 Tax=Shouchella patagoniensis TaxID=228576 RepID=UPI001FE881F7|nr:helix-turn-helix transcriptional regulator [Shouchella patagoniensis]
MPIKKGKEALEELHNSSIEEEDRTVIELKVGEAIRSRGLTQKEVAEKSGIRPTAISNLARGYVDRISLDHLSKIVRALDIKDINELITINVESEAMQNWYHEKIEQDNEERE